MIEYHTPPIFIGGDSINSFMSWVGGKKALRELILLLFPLYYERYIEVFGGAGWVLFGKPPGNDFEVYNDWNPNLANLYRCVRDSPEELIEALRYVLNSREDFDILRTQFKADTHMTDIQRAAGFYQIIRYSYASGCDSYSCQPHDIWSNFPVIRQAANRLRKVVVENKDFTKLIRQYDRPVSFFYCDPPYVDTESYYENVSFTEKDHLRLRDTLLSINGKFLLSYNDCELVRELYDGCYMQEVSRLNNIKQRYDGSSQYKELLIANYDISERQRMMPEQLRLCDNQPMKI